MRRADTSNLTPSTLSTGLSSWTRRASRAAAARALSASGASTRIEASVEPGTGAVGRISRSVEIANAEIIFFRRAGHPAYLLSGVARTVDRSAIYQNAGEWTRAPSTTFRASPLGVESWACEIRAKR